MNIEWHLLFFGERQRGANTEVFPLLRCQRIRCVPFCVILPLFIDLVKYTCGMVSIRMSSKSTKRSRRNSCIIEVNLAMLNGFRDGMVPALLQNEQCALHPLVTLTKIFTGGKTRKPGSSLRLHPKRFNSISLPKICINDVLFCDGYDPMHAVCQPAYRISSSQTINLRMARAVLGIITFYHSL